MSTGGPPSPFKTKWKGKEKAASLDDEFVDLNPLITYRHLTSDNLNARDPLRVVSLCDSDAFYAACEMARLGIFDKPLVVLQWQALIAVNYPARKFGITRMMKISEAKEKCPDLVVVHVATYKEGEKEPGYWDNVDTKTHKVSLDFYRRESAKILSIFKEVLVGAEIEKSSIDEAFFDLTKPVKKIMLERYPELHVSDKNAIDKPLPQPPPIAWNDGYVVPINPQDSDASGDTTQAASWHDIALSIGAELMHNVRAEIQTRLGYTTSAGIARNKFLAKLAASCKKPNNQSILRNSAIPNYLKPLAFQKIRFLGGKLGDALAQEYDVLTVQDLLLVSLEKMQESFSEDAIWIYQLLRGIDYSEVKEKYIVNKSMLASKNLPKPITKSSEGYHWIRVLAAELALRLNDARDSNPNLWPKSLVLHAKKGYESSRSKQAPFPFSKNLNVDTISSAGNKLWKELVGPNSDSLKISSVQLAFTGIEVSEAGQQSIETFLASGSKRQREIVTVDDDDDDEGFGGRPSFLCEDCGKRVTGDGISLGVLKQEHSDLHLAQRLSMEGREPEVQPVKKRRKKSPVGIEKFFKKL